ncbi:hypothetical protein [Pedobacter jeongneungensis]|uniref:hypothetical protein n=1 Tax=Pedobacter jeongneungensis TaxID=947309 RepID=UPI000A5B163F|nr:hypothetical protein [Pedobacter jeongneungensis]
MEIRLEENIPLNDEDLKHIETQEKGVKNVLPFVLGGSISLLMAFTALLLKDHFADFKYYDYILFVGAGFAMYGFCYCFAWLVMSYDSANWKKDKAGGKNKLISVVINRDKTEHAEYLTFAGPDKNGKIRIRVKPEDYSRYPIGTKVAVIYLKFSKEALALKRFDYCEGVPNPIYANGGHGNRHGIDIISKT